MEYRQRTEGRWKEEQGRERREGEKRREKEDRGRKEERMDGGQKEGGRMEREWRLEGGRKEAWWGRTAIIFQFDSQVNCGSRRLRDKQKIVQMVSGRVRTRPQVS